MAKMLRAGCPKCRAELRIPADWAGKSVTCKACGATVRTKPAAPTPAAPTPAASTPVVPPTNAPIPAVPAATAVPVEVLPVAVPADDSELVFVASEVTRKHMARKRRSPVLAYLGIAVMLTAVGVGAALYGRPLLDQLAGTAAVETPEVSIAVPPPPVNENFLNASRRYPRRVLGISVTKYLYCNALTAGNARNPDMVSIALRRLAYQWKVPMEPGNDQLFLLQDSGKTARPVLRNTIADAVRKFCGTSRPQDRVLIYFGGHATEIEGAAYLVPAEGELTAAETLVPLADVWAALKDCPAQQKVIVFDVARLNENGDAIRPGSEPLSESLAKLLTAAPDGVQVLTTASPGTNALEFRNAPPDAPEEGGSLFLSTLIHLAENGKVRSGLEAKPDDPLPVAAWFEMAKPRMALVAKVAAKPDPAPTLSEAKPGELVAHDDTIAPAQSFDFAPAPQGMPAAEVATLTQPIRDLPPYRGKSLDDVPVETLVPFSAEVMKDYNPGDVSFDDIRKSPDKYPLRYAALTSLDLIRKEWRSSVAGGSELRTQILTGTNDAFKKTIIEEQETPARITDELETKIMQVEELMDKLEDEPSKYWRVTYLYALAQLKARLAFMSEYNLALGNIRTDNLPKVDEGKGQAGLTLVSTERMKSKREVKDLAEAAAELFDRVAAEHPGTPWAVEAKRYRAVALGLEWRPFTAANSRVIE